jgi:hypothetical protein
MKDRILLTLLVSTILVSCSSVYKSGQTPDDVYYSPTREVVKTEQKQEDKEDYTANTEDQYLKMKVRDRYRWSQIDDYDYWVDSRYNNHCSCTCNQPSYGYNYHYGYYPIRYGNWYNNPYSPYYVAYNPTFIKGSTSSSNIKAYTNHTYNNTNSSVNTKTGSTTNGSFLKRVITSAGTTTDRTERTFGGGSSSSSSSSGTSSSAGGKSGGYGSSGSSTGTGRGGRGN